MYFTALVSTSPGITAYFISNDWFYTQLMCQNACSRKCQKLIWVYERSNWEVFEALTTLRFVYFTERLTKPDVQILPYNPAIPLCCLIVVVVVVDGDVGYDSSRVFFFWIYRILHFYKKSRLLLVHLNRNDLSNNNLKLSVKEALLPSSRSFSYCSPCLEPWEGAGGAGGGVISFK